MPITVNTIGASKCLDFPMILMNHFSDEPEELIQQELAAAEQVLRSGWYILGHAVEQFEAAWAESCQTEYAVGVGNGMDALEIGLRTLGIGHGDEVITTAMTAFATVLAILRAGAIPVLADIEPHTALLDLQSVERCLTSRTKAVLLVHLYGQVSQLDKWVEFCDRNHLYLLEDCAQAHLARWQGQVAGSFGHWGAYSFYPTKNLGAIGDAGALVTHSADIATQAKILRNYGQTERYHHPYQGINSRLDELQAALLSVRLSWLAQFTQKRQQIAKAYHQGINHPEISPLAIPDHLENHVYHLFVVRSAQRDALMQYLKSRDIQTLIHYPIPIHHQEPCLAALKDPMGLTQTEQHSAQCLSLPCHPQMSDVDVYHIIQAINDFSTAA
jgi:dTDP-4-amino-4,6-dideoxygalactose transaminase